MSKGGGKILIGLFMLSGFFYCLVSVRLALLPGKVQATSSPAVVINEIAWMGNATNENQEWIELKNNSLEAIDLTNWKLKAIDGTPDIALKGVIEPDGYFLLERTSELSVPNVTSSQIYTGALGNGGELLELFDASSTVIDQVTASSSWTAGDNTTKQTMERGDDGSWHSSVLTGGTPAQPNSLPATTTIDILPDVSTASTTVTTTQAVVTESPSASSNPVAAQVADLEIEITELLPNPKGSDAAGEFIELFNADNAAVDLTGWKIVIGNHQYVIAATSSRSNILLPRGYLTVWRAESKLVLPNDQGQVLLYSPEKSAPRQIVGYEKALDGKSYAKNDLSEWRWSEQPTPGNSNIIKEDNQAPEVDWSVKSLIEAGEAVLFDSSDTTDPEDDKLFFEWQFGDGASSTEPNPKHMFEKPGRFKVELTVSDGEDKSSKSRTLTVVAAKSTSTPKLPIPLTIKVTSIIINEFLPNPAGEDADGEWVELFNAGKEAVDLLNWQLDDAAGGSKAFQFSDSVIVAPLAYYLVNREDSNIALNNGADEVRLFDFQGRLIESINYSGAKEGVSYARDGRGRWQWSTPTPEKANQVIKIIAPAKATAKKTKTIVASKAKTSSKKISTSKTGSWLTIEGKVTALPGQIAKQIFYITAGDCWQIYNYRRDFPKLNLGDQVRIYGQVENIKGEKRLKTSKLADIKVTSAGHAVAPTELQCQQIGPSQLSKLVKVTGELTKKNATLWYLDDDSGEVAVHIAKAIADNFSRVEEGEKITVTGLVTPATAGVRIVPRSIADIVPIKAAQAETYPEPPNSIPARDSAVELREYLQLIGLGVVLAGFGWWLRKRYAI